MLLLNLMTFYTVGDLAQLFDSLFGSVVYASVDCDSDTQYPKVCTPLLSVIGWMSQPI